MQQLKPHFFPHPGLHSRGADHPSTFCCTLQRPLWASPQSCSAWPWQQTEEGENPQNFSPNPIFARPSPVHIFQLNIYDSLPAKLDLLGAQTPQREGSQPGDPSRAHPSAQEEMPVASLNKPLWYQHCCNCWGALRLFPLSSKLHSNKPLCQSLFAPVAV